MANTVQVRNIKLGEGIPKICVPLVGKTNEEIIEEAKFLKNIKFDLIEWRVDYYENVEDIKKVNEILKELRKQIGDTVILFTFRSKKEGGEKEISKEYYAELNKQISKTKLVDLVDVELFTGDEIVKDVVKTAHENDVKIVMSNHDFFKTPSKEEIINRLCKMQDLDADLPKIAVMPNTSEDVVTLLAATEEMSTKYAKQPIITMSMGSLGLVSRLSGETFGSAITFGAARKTSAPGQISVDKLALILEVMHQSI
ncbi:type I 3-dehydroquinate dehydratase [Intestinibacter sp.]|uniref:type I 3-dehydroquinate dehydratase n=1 Tax=Intestinibacter sp. TaxID=1965304 RepID=UPI002A9116C1|nr:type I 3-dehydroquinate dehydratase [Intestinibacter sp.]MDY5212013.1 type I 3-dehydroquinate dehydratase [Intestinibacter sp.]